jgi:hypothetical protein
MALMMALEEKDATGLPKCPIAKSSLLWYCSIKKGTVA